MVKIHLVGGENLVVDVIDTAPIRDALRHPDEVIEVTHDGRAVFIPVRAIAAVALL